MTDILDDEELAKPGKPDFRRVGKQGTPFVLNPDGRRVRYGRPSNAGKILDDESQLTKWKLRKVVEGAAQRPDLLAMASTYDPIADKGKIQDIAEECIVAGKGQERTVKGIAVHSMFDHIDRQDDWEPAPQWVGLCNNYVSVLEWWGLVPEDIEVHCINDEFRLAGSMDRRYRTTKLLVAPDSSTVPIASRVAADTKTGATLEYASGTYATQLAAYAHSQRYDVETDERIPFDPPTFPDWGLIIHADSGSTEVQIFWVDLNAGLEGLRLSQQVKGWRTRSDLLTLGAGPRLVAPEPVPEAPQMAQDGPEALGLLDHTRNRVRAVLAYSEVAGKALQRQWPEGIPGLKAGGHTREQLTAIIAVIQKVEADYSVPFYPRWVDPDEAEHPSRYSDKWAKPNDNDPPDLAAAQALGEAINLHPRKEVIRAWIAEAIKGGMSGDHNPYAMAHALYEFANLDGDDESLTTLLDGTVRAMGFTRGLLDLGNIPPSRAPEIMAAAFSIAADTAMLLYGEDGKPVLRTNIVKG